MKKFFSCIPHILTFFRALIAPAIIWCLAQQTTATFWGALFLFTVASGTDFLDGWIARRLGVASDFGAFLDPLADKILLWTVSSFLVFKNVMHPGLLALIIGRDLMTTLIRLGKSEQGGAIKTLWSGKIKTTLQYLYCYGGIALFWILPTTISFWVLEWGLWFVSGALIFITLYSGLWYVAQVLGMKSKIVSTGAWAIATAGGAGFLPVMPGTWGSLVGLLYVAFLPVEYLALSLALFLGVGAWATEVVLVLTGDNDPKYIIIDEFVGILSAFLMIEAVIRLFSWHSFLTNPSVLLVFLLFRFFDVTKLGLVGSAERLPGAWGVIADDLVAGFLSGAFWWGFKIVLDFWFL